MSKDCDIVKDLIIGYKENSLRENSISFVEEHIKSCIECKNYLKMVEDDIEEENNKLTVLKNKIITQEEEYSDKKKKDAKHLKKFRSDLKDKLEEKYPTPQKPVKPKKPLIGISIEGMSEVQIANEQIMADLVDFLRSEDAWRLYTAREIVMDCEDVSQYVPQKIEALLGQLVKRGIVECFTEKGKNFYKINENYQR